MGAYLLRVLLNPFWDLIKSGWTLFVQSQTARIVAASLLVFLLAGFGIHQCSQKRTAKEALRVTAAHVSRLQSDTLTLQRTITGATAITKIDYAKQQKQLTQDSIRVASLPESVLEHETDSLLRANRAYLAARAGNQ